MVIKARTLVSVDHVQENDNYFRTLMIEVDMMERCFCITGVRLT